MLALLESYYVGKVNVTFEKYKFRTRTQKEGESVMTYIGELRRLSHSCDFENVTTDQLIRDQIVCGVRYDGLRRKLLQAKDLTLENCVSTCRASEVARVQASSMAEDTRQAKKETDSEIHLVSQRKQWMERGLRKSANVGTDQI